ncbi:MAG TPA: hypothetical protein VLF93_07255 [Candidatus Saccharimonadales bacterium]|nr:hypothetical protein [Candidatus Saccharimonadales bacterium]
MRQSKTWRSRLATLLFCVALFIVIFNSNFVNKVHAAGPTFVQVVAQQPQTVKQP